MVITPWMDCVLGLTHTSIPHEARLICLSFLKDLIYRIKGVILYLQFIEREGNSLGRFKRGLCILMAALISFSLATEIMPGNVDASSLTEEAALEQVDLDEAKKTKKKAKTIPYEVPEGAELTYRAYMHGKGWDKEYTKQGMVCGKPGKGLSIEALEIGIKSDIEGKVCCNTYLDGIGWTGQAGNFEAAGNAKAKKPMQKLKIYLTGRLLVRYRIFYRVCLDTNGWLGWCCDGFVTGNEDYDRCIEAVQIVLVERSAGDTKLKNINGVVSKTTSYYKSATKIKNYMTKKAQKYKSNTNYLIMIDSEYCFLGVYKGRKNHWKLVKFYICSPGNYERFWRGVFTTSTKTHGFYSFGSQVYWGTRIHGPIWIHSITYKGHNGKKVLDARLGKRISHGCIRIATKNAKWLHDNVPSYTKCVMYKKKFL